MLPGKGSIRTQDFALSFFLKLLRLFVILLQLGQIGTFRLLGSLYEFLELNGFFSILYCSPNLRNTDIENKYQTEPKGKNRKCCHSKLTLTEHGQKLTKVVSIKKTPFYLSYLSVGIFRPDGSKTRFLMSFEFRRRSN